MTTTYSTVTAYTFQADVHCPTCIRTMAAFALAGPGEAAFMGRPTDGDDCEEFLDRWAAVEGVDRNDECTFDSGDFPKVILYGQMNPQAVWICGTCFAFMGPTDD